MDKNESKKDSKITIEFDQLTIWKFATVILGILFIVSIVTGGFRGSDSGNDIVVDDNAPDDNIPQQIDVKIDLKGEPALGDADAPIEIVEYSDFQCPFCKRAFDQTYPEIKKNYIDTGKVRYIYKDYPLPFHTEADEAAIAANCVYMQDEEKYWEMHDKLFSTQAEWSGSADPNTFFKGLVKELDIDESKFDSCLKDEKVRKEIEEDTAEGASNGVSGTPSFFINGVQIVGAQPFSAFKQVIDSELSKAS